MIILLHARPCLLHLLGLVQACVHTVLVISYGEGWATNGKIMGPKPFVPPPPQESPPSPHTHTFYHYGCRSEDPALKQPQNLLCTPPPFRMAKSFSAPFFQGKTSLAPSPPILQQDPPPPVITDQSLTSPKLLMNGIRDY